MREDEVQLRIRGRGHMEVAAQSLVSSPFRVVDDSDLEVLSGVQEFTRRMPVAAHSSQPHTPNFLGKQLTQAPGFAPRTMHSDAGQFAGMLLTERGDTLV